MADFLVMAKAGGSRCDMRCAYCYYLGVEAELGPRMPGRMSEELIELYVSQRFRAAASGGAAQGGAAPVHFEWHGGEPTALGLAYYKSVARIQRRLAPAGLAYSNGIQTNGLALDGAWAEFLAAERWSVGLSLDGPAAYHDRCRRAASGGPSHERVMRSYERLAEKGVFVNLLCVLSSVNAERPDEVYGFFRSIGARYLQFLPLVTPVRRGEEGRALPHPLAATPEAIGDFLCRAFDLWLAADVGRIVVQDFDEALRPIYGRPHALCVHRETCGDVLVLERDGGVYACDHFVDAAHRLGSIRERELGELAASPAAAAFGEAKRSGLPGACKSCEFLASCNGGCPKDRFVRAEGGAEGELVSYLCPAYKRFFAHARPGLEALAAHMKAGKALRDFEPPLQR